MRIGASTLNNKRSLSNNSLAKGILPYQVKDISATLIDGFEVLNAWDPIRGTWTTDGNKVSTSTSSSSYPLLTSFDIRSQNITATLSLDSAGSGVAFWVQDQDNWWAAFPFYSTGSESYITSSYECNCRVIGCWGYYCNWAYNGKTFVWTCRCLENTRCDTCYNTASRSRYDFYLKLIKSESGVVSEVTNILIRSTASTSTSFSPATVSSDDNLNGIEITTNDDIITIRGRDDSNNFYSDTISYTASSPNRGFKSGLIYAPGGNYLLSSAATSITLVAA